MQRIKETNQWEHIQVFIGKRKVVDGDKVRLQFPNGSTEVFVVKIKHRNATVHDMGHRYDVTQEIPTVVIDYNGLKVELKVSDFKLGEFV